MKKYLFGLGAMLIGAGLMFVFTHTDVRAESLLGDYDFICIPQSHATWDKQSKQFIDRRRIQECQKGKTICYLYEKGISCFHQGMFK